MYANLEVLLVIKIRLIALTVKAKNVKFASAASFFLLTFSMKLNANRLKSDYTAECQISFFWANQGLRRKDKCSFY